MGAIAGPLGANQVDNQVDPVTGQMVLGTNLKPSDVKSDNPELLAWVRANNRDRRMKIAKARGDIRTNEDPLGLDAPDAPPPPPDESKAYFRALARAHTERGLRRTGGRRGTFLTGNPEDRRLGV